MTTDDSMYLDDKTPVTKTICHPLNGDCALTLTVWHWHALDVIVNEIGRPFESILAKCEETRGDFDLGFAVRRLIEGYVREYRRDEAA